MSSRRSKPASYASQPPTAAAVSVQPVRVCDVVAAVGEPTADVYVGLEGGARTVRVPLDTKGVAELSASCKDEGPGNMPVCVRAVIPELDSERMVGARVKYSYDAGDQAEPRSVVGTFEIHGSPMDARKPVLRLDDGTIVVLPYGHLDRAGGSIAIMGLDAAKPLGNDHPLLEPYVEIETEGPTSGLVLALRGAGISARVNYALKLNEALDAASLSMTARVDNNTDSTFNGASVTLVESPARANDASSERAASASQNYDSDRDESNSYQYTKTKSKRMYASAVPRSAAMLVTQQQVVQVQQLGEESAAFAAKHTLPYRTRLAKGPTTINAWSDNVKLRTRFVFRPQYGGAPTMQLQWPKPLPDLFTGVLEVSVAGREGVPVRLTSVPLNRRCVRGDKISVLLDTGMAVSARLVSLTSGGGTIEKLVDDRGVEYSVRRVQYELQVENPLKRTAIKLLLVYQFAHNLFINDSKAIGLNFVEYDDYAPGEMKKGLLRQVELNVQAIPGVQTFRFSEFFEVNGNA